MSLLKGVKGLFVKQDPEAEVAPEQPEVAEAASAAPAQKNSRYSGRGRSAAPAEVSAAGEPDEDILAGLRAAIEQNKTTGYGYLEFSETLSNMEKSVPDEETRYKAAGASAKAMKCTPSKLVSSAQASLEVLDGEEALLKKELADAAEIDAEKKAELEEVEKQMKTLENKKNKLSEELRTSESKTEEAKRRFTVSKNFLAKNIKDDISKIEEYLSK